MNWLNLSINTTENRVIQPAATMHAVKKDFARRAASFSRTAKI
jgi:hypothetical protein